MKSSSGFLQDALDDSCFELYLSETKILPSEARKVNDARSTVSSRDSPHVLQEEVDEFLIEAIDKALSSLRETVKTTIYQRLQNDYGI